MNLPPGFAFAAVIERADPRDAFVSSRCRSLSELPAGSRVGTSSLRRESQLRARHPRLTIEPLRGNVPTRLKKLDAGQYDAIILAAAGLKRLGLEARITILLTPEESLPAVGQGAIGLECRTERADVVKLLAPLSRRDAQCVPRARSRALAACNVPLSGLPGDGEACACAVSSARRRLAARGRSSGTDADPEALAGRWRKLKAQGAAEILAALGNTGRQ
jgi:hydroxymethylbilane synthase